MGRKKATLTGRVSYRLTEDDFKFAEDIARNRGVSVHELGREAFEAVIKQAKSGGQPDQWESYRLLAQVRFLVGHGLRLMAEGKLNTRDWERLREEAEKGGTAIAADLLKKARGDDIA